MSIEENKVAIRRLFEAISTGNTDVLNELLIPNREALKNGITAFRAAFPNAKLIVEQLFAEDDKVVCHVAVSGKHQKEWLGATSTGKEITWTASLITRFDNGKMVELWAIRDELSMMQQLCIIPAIGG